MQRNIDKMPNSEPFIGIFLPKKMIKKNATAGMIGMMNAFSRNQPDFKMTSAASVDAENMS
jgi:hypothetical protein